MATRMKSQAFATFGLILATVLHAAMLSAAERSDTHAQYARDIWNFLDSKYENWDTTEQEFAMPSGLSVAGTHKIYRNKIAEAGDGTYDKGSVVVVEHFAEDQPVAVTVCVRASDGYNSSSNDWYWAHYLPDGTIVRTVADKDTHDKRGFFTKDEDGRLWVFRLGTKELHEFLTRGDLGKRVIRPGAGPGGMTLLGPDADLLTEYAAAANGFVVMVEDGRLWVFRDGSDELADFQKTGDLAKRVIKPGAGPAGTTLLGPDADVLTEYMVGADGFHVQLDDGRLWVFRSDSDELAEFQKTGDLAKYVIRPAAGPDGRTVKSPDAETLDEYLRIVSQR